MGISLSRLTGVILAFLESIHTRLVIKNTLNQTLIKQPGQHFVQRTGAEPDLSLAQGLYVFQDGVAVLLLGRKAEQNVGCWLGEG